MQKNVVTPFYCIFNLLQISSQTYLTRFIISNANIIPKEEVTSCGQLDTNNIAFTIFGGSWNKEKNNEYPPNSTPQTLCQQGNGQQKTCASNRFCRHKNLPLYDINFTRGTYLKPID